MSLKLPFEGQHPITQEFGNDLVINGEHIYQKMGMKGHNGIDFSMVGGTPILAPFSGTIIEAQFDANGYGNYVKLEDNEQGSTLAHLESLAVTSGQHVEQGHVLGHSGNTGNSTGHHLHWGYYQLPRNRSNGYDGYIDQLPLLESLGLLNSPSVGGFTYASTQDIPADTPIKINVVDSSQPDYYPSPDADKKVDLNNKESVKVCVDTWIEVVSGGFIRTSVAEKEANQSRMILAQEFDKQIKELEAERDMLKDVIARYEANPQGNPEEETILKKQVETLSNQLNVLTNELVELQKKYQILEASAQADRDRVKEESVDLSEYVHKSILDETLKLNETFQKENLELKDKVRLLNKFDKLVTTYINAKQSVQTKDVPKLLQTLQDISSIILNFHLMFKSHKQQGASTSQAFIKGLGY